ncbi:MAG: TIGR03118 family protein [Methylococcales bacterium]
MDYFKQRTAKHLLFGVVALICNLAVNTTALAEDLHPHRGYYMQRNLVTNNVDKHQSERHWNNTTIEDTNMLNAWGLALRPAGAGGHWWIANTDSGTVSLYVGDTIDTPLFQNATALIAVESAPATPDDPATPTGQVFNGSPEFPCWGKTIDGDNPVFAPGKFMVVTEDGNIQCWGETGASNAERMKSFTIAVEGDEGSVYKGLAVTQEDSGNFLFAANFALQRIDVFDGQFNPVINVAPTFIKPADIPEDYAPFNIQYFEYNGNQSLFVAYAKTTDVPGEEEAGPGLGYLAEFDIHGHNIRTFEHSNRLNAPWGLAITPHGFGPFSNEIVLGNFGDGTLVSFDLNTGEQTGYLRNELGEAVHIDGLWGLAFGNGESLGQSNYLYFTAGPNDEADGLFGRLNWKRR